MGLAFVFLYNIGSTRSSPPSNESLLTVSGLVGGSVDVETICDVEGGDVLVEASQRVSGPLAPNLFSEFDGYKQQKVNLKMYQPIRQNSDRTFKTPASY